MGKTIVNVGELEVLVRSVPPTATVHWQKAHLDIPDKPGRPMVEITSKLDGHTEIVPALPDSDEWDGWVAEMQRWYDEAERIQNERSHEQLEFHLDYAILGWREAGSEDDWQEVPPEDWQPPDVLRRHGIDVPEDRRLAYVLYVILDEPWKTEVIVDAAWDESRDPERDKSPVRDEEVSAVLDKFRSGEENTGRVMGPTSRGTRQRNTDERIRTRDAKSRRDGDRSGLLARIVSWL